ncbi:uncharacterized protein LOC116032721 [Ipomoea triloba]|uniref:uncharacterized protein LOC116032721 n=1 Tax=Ipomoea triloba TaxID=35885 RepID=UPI00125E9E36|nr:uncharacterized protein LOC116032721 [Ipomoea triloba]
MVGREKSKCDSIEVVDVVDVGVRDSKNFFHKSLRVPVWIGSSLHRSRFPWLISAIDPVEILQNIPHKVLLQNPPKPYAPPVPFPGRLKNSKFDRSFSEIYDLLSKVNVNLPLLDMIKNMPAYAKFLKELNTRKRRYTHNEKVFISKTVSAVLQTDLPPKLEDPDSFIITITLGNSKKEKAMLDLGTSINLMPYSIYLQLGLHRLKPTTMSLELSDRSVRYPRGIVEDVLVQVDKLIIPADFVVLDINKKCNHAQDMLIFLGRPFMATAKTMIDVQNGKLTMTVLDETVEFSILKSMKLPENNNNHCFAVDILDSIISAEFLDESPLKVEADEEEPNQSPIKEGGC